jgi:signal transduction histidine kinase
VLYMNSYQAQPSRLSSPGKDAVPSDYFSQALQKSALRLPAFRFASLFLAFVLLAVAGFIAFVTVERMKGSRDQVLHTYQVRGFLKDLRSEVAETHAQFDLFQISNNLNEINGMDQQLQNELSIVGNTKQLTADNPTQQVRLDELRVVLQEDLDQLRTCVISHNCPKAGTTERDAFMTELSGRRRKLSRMLRDMEDTEQSLLDARLRTWDRLFSRMVITLIGCFVLALVLLFYNFNLLFAEIQRRKEQEDQEKRNAESFRLLSARILELQDVERRKIARELHDSVGQFLAGLKLNLGRLQRSEFDATAENHALLTETIDLTDKAIGEVRTISYLLHPPLLDELGFHSAARWYVEGFAKRSGIEVQLRLSEIADRLPREIELALFRVLQESLTNVHRHAMAHKVEIELECTDDEVKLLVCDDGKGLKAGTLLRFRSGQAAGIGLAGMRERLSELGGSLEVESSNVGTQIRATLPTNECDPADAPALNVSISPN